MANQDDLHSLILSLSPSEKRYFKIFANRHVQGKGNNHVRLFDALNAQEVFDAEGIRAKFKGEALERNLPSEKKHLKKLILRAMRAFHADKGTDKQLREFLDDAAFLQGKRLYGHSRKILEKALKLAQKFDRFTVQLDILEMDRENIVKIPKGMKEEMSKNLSERELFIRFLSQKQQLQELFDTLFLAVRKKFVLRKDENTLDASRLLQNPLLQSSPIPNFTLENLRLRALAMAHQLLNHKPEILETWLNLKENWEKHPHRIKDDPNGYTICLSNLLTASLANGAMERFPEILEKLRKAPTQNEDETAETMQNVLYYELIYLMNLNQLEKAKAQIPTIEKNLKKYEKRWNKARKLAYFYNLAWLFFLLEDFSGGMTWLVRILHDERSEHRIDLQLRARLMQMLFHYELGNFEIMESLRRSTKRAFQQQERWGKGENFLVKSLIKLLDTPKTSEQKRRMEEMEKEFESMKNETVAGHEFGLWMRARNSLQPIRSLI